MEHITAPELAAWIADPERPSPLLLDVREPWEYQTCKIEGSVSIPMNTIPGSSNSWTGTPLSFASVITAHAACA